MKRPCCCDRGACCLPDETCKDNITQKTCERSIEDGGLGGIYQGTDSVCADPLINCFRARGACCFCENEDDVTCVNTYLQEDCDIENGIYQGDDTACETLPTGFRGLGDPPGDGGLDCACTGYGSCCLPNDNGCVILSCEECCLNEGEFRGDGTQCIDGLCDSPEPPLLGTCCYYPSCCLNQVCYRIATRTNEESCSEVAGDFYPGVWPDEVECETFDQECACHFFMEGIFTCWNINLCHCDFLGGVFDCDCPCWECCNECCLHSDCEEDWCCNGGICESCDGIPEVECTEDFECVPLCCVEGQCVNCPWGGDTCCHPINCDNPEEHEPCPDGHCCVCVDWFGCIGSGQCCAQCEPCPPRGACCFEGGQCAEIEDPTTCDGDWYGFNSKCVDITCFEEIPCNCSEGVCCIEEQCYDNYNYSQCLVDGGYYGGDDTTCNNFECV